MVQAFEIIAGGQKNPRMKELLDGIRFEIEGGSSLSEAIGKYPVQFDELYRNLVRAGESAGVLDTVLDTIASYKENIETLKGKIKKALFYPAICFKLRGRGFLDEGYYADLVVFDPDGTTQIRNSDVLYKCGWTPLDNDYLKGKIMSTWVNGQCVWDGRNIISAQTSKRLVFGFNV